MSVLANSNIQILWEVLNGLISENKLKIKDTGEFRVFFDHKCKEYHVRRFDYNGLGDINKHIVSECFDYLKKASEESQLLMFREYEQYGNKNVINNLQVGKRYEEHQNNFKTMINAKKPNEVDFTENTDSPINNMDDEMSKRMEERESEMNMITNKYNQNHESIKWLNNSGDIPPKLTIHDEGTMQSGGDGMHSEIEKSKDEKNKSKDEKKTKKKVKFKSDFLKNMDEDDKKNDESNDKSNDKEIKEKAKIFQDLTENMNKKNEENSKIFLEKREIIKTMDVKEEEKDDTNIMEIFGKMKKKTNKSDIDGAQKIDLIDIHRKMNKMEQYLVDILKNQMILMEQ